MNYETTWEAIEAAAPESLLKEIAPLEALDAHVSAPIEY